MVIFIILNNVVTNAYPEIALSNFICTNWKKKIFLVYSFHFIHFKINFGKVNVKWQNLRVFLFSHPLGVMHMRAYYPERVYTGVSYRRFLKSSKHKNGVTIDIFHTLKQKMKANKI